MDVEIRRTNSGEELWIDSTWCYRTSLLITDGNTVAHIMARHCTKLGFPVNYRMVTVSERTGWRVKAARILHMLMHNLLVDPVSRIWLSPVKGTKGKGVR